jgi:hypothetical protein
MLIKLASITTLMACSSVANANLYVSPVVKDEASINYNSTKKDSKSEFGELKVGVSDESVNIVMTSGRDLPLFLAVENIVPQDDYQVHFEEGIHETEITWSGGNDWKDVLYVMARQNNLSVYINEKEKVVGISGHKDLSYHLAKKMPTVWSIDTSKSLRENLKEWAVKAGWQLEWDQTLDIDFNAPHDSVFLGDFVGAGGVVDEILKAYPDSDVKLKPVFYLKNRVVLITKGGHEQSLSF